MPNTACSRPSGNGRNERIAVHEVVLGHGHGLGATGQGLVGGGDARLVSTEHAGINRRRCVRVPRFWRRRAAAPASATWPTIGRSVDRAAPPHATGPTGEPTCVGGEVDPVDRDRFTAVRGTCRPRTVRTRGGTQIGNGSAAAGGGRVDRALRASPPEETTAATARRPGRRVPPTTSWSRSRRSPASRAPTLAPWRAAVRPRGSAARRSPRRAVPRGLVLRVTQPVDDVTAQNLQLAVDPAR